MAKRHFSLGYHRRVWKQNMFLRRERRKTPSQTNKLYMEKSAQDLTQTLKNLDQGNQNNFHDRWNTPSHYTRGLVHSGSSFTKMADI